MNTENYYDRCNQSFVHYRSEPLTAVVWQSLPKSEIWTTAQYLKLKDESFAPLSARSGQGKTIASFGRSKGFLHFGFAFSRNDNLPVHNWS